METRPIKMSICRSIGAFICRNKFGWGLGEFALQEFNTPKWFTANSGLGQHLVVCFLLYAGHGIYLDSESLLWGLFSQWSTTSQDQGNNESQKAITRSLTLRIVCSATSK